MLMYQCILLRENSMQSLKVMTKNIKIVIISQGWLQLVKTERKHFKNGNEKLRKIK